MIPAGIYTLMAKAGDVNCFAESNETSSRITVGLFPYSALTAVEAQRRI